MEGKYYVLGHVPIIDQHPRTRAGKEALKRETKAQRAAGFAPPARERYKERPTVERVFGRLKDEYGGRSPGRCPMEAPPRVGRLDTTVYKSHKV